MCRLAVSRAILVERFKALMGLCAAMAFEVEGMQEFLGALGLRIGEELLGIDVYKRQAPYDLCHGGVIGEILAKRVRLARPMPVRASGDEQVIPLCQCKQALSLIHI